MSIAARWGFGPALTAILSAWHDAQATLVLGPEWPAEWCSEAGTRSALGRGGRVALRLQELEEGSPGPVGGGPRGLS